MYDPTIGRWLSEDPIGFQAADANLYRYVGNNPTNLTDPSGLEGIKPEGKLVGLPTDRTAKLKDNTIMIGRHALRIRARRRGRPRSRRPTGCGRADARRQTRTR